MNIELNISKKHLYILTALVIVFAGLIFAVAYGTNNPAVFGHTASEIEGLSIPKVNSVVGTTNIQTSNTNYDDMLHMTYTDTFTAGNILVTFNAPFSVAGYGQAISFQITIDSVSKVVGQFGVTGSSLHYGSPMISWAGPITAGSHTIKVQWKVNGGTGSQSGLTHGQRTLTIIRGLQ